MKRSLARSTLLVLFLSFAALSSSAQVSEGVALMHANLYDATRGYGVTVAVIDRQFGGLQPALDAGVLRCSARDRRCGSDLLVNDGGTHGFAAAQIVRDMAPGAQIILLQVRESEDLDVAVQHCINNGVRIISHSMVYYYDNFVDGSSYTRTGTCYDGPCPFYTANYAVDRATAAGILFVTGAGNDGDKTIDGTFTDANGDGKHDQTYTVTTDGPLAANLAWNQFPQRAGNFQIRLVHSTSGFVISASSATIPVPSVPFADIPLTTVPGGTYTLEVHRLSSSTTPRFKIRVLAGTLANAMPYGSLVSPADANGAVSVGAIDRTAYPYGAPLPMSSRGPRTPSHPEPIPMFTAPTNVYSAFAPGNVFGGTSAATPHVAGAAAILLWKTPTFTRDQLLAALKAHARDVTVTGVGVDNDTGYGSIDLCVGASTPIAVASTVSAGSTLNRALTGDSPALPRQWTITNGVITQSDAYGIWFTAGASGPVTLGVTVGTGVCVKTGTIAVPVCTSTVSPASMSIPPNGGFRAFNVTSTCSWTSRSSDDSWVTFYTGKSGTGNQTVNVQFAANPNPYPRTATLEIAGNTVTVTQQGTVSRRSDFDGDGKADYAVLNRTSGQLFLRLMNGPVTMAQNEIPGVLSNYRAVGSGDLNGDGKADMVWRRVGIAGCIVWLMDGTTMIDVGYPTPDADPNWIAIAVADFDGDGKADILWRHATTFAFDVTLMNALTVHARGRLGTSAANWIFSDVGDVNGDGRADIIGRESTTGQWAIQLVNGTTVAGAQVYPVVPLSWTLAAVADVDGNGRSDVIWRNSNGQLKVQRMNGLTSIDETIVFTDTDTSWPVIGAGDFNGDGMEDLFWWKLSGELRILQMNGIAAPAAQTVFGTYPNAQWVVVAPTTTQMAHRP